MAWIKSALLPALLLLIVLPSIVLPEAESQDNFFKITVDTPENGSITLEPPIPEDGRVAAGTVIRVAADPGLVAAHLDAGPGRGRGRLARRWIA